MKSNKLTKYLTTFLSMLVLLPGFLLGLMVGALGVLTLFYLAVTAQKGAHVRPTAEAEPTRRARSGTLDDLDVICVEARQDTKCVN